MWAHRVALIGLVTVGLVLACRSSEDSAELEEAQPEGRGLTGAYYPNAEWEGDPVHRRVDPRINFEWLPPSSPLRPPFSIEWTGALEIDEAGVYVFVLESDDGSILEIDRTLVVDNEHAKRRRTRDAYCVDCGRGLFQGR